MQHIVYREDIIEHYSISLGAELRVGFLLSLDREILVKCLFWGSRPWTVDYLWGYKVIYPEASWGVTKTNPRFGRPFANQFLCNQGMSVACPTSQYDLTQGFRKHINHKWEISKIMHCEFFNQQEEEEGGRKQVNIKVSELILSSTWGGISLSLTYSNNLLYFPWSPDLLAVHTWRWLKGYLWLISGLDKELSGLQLFWVSFFVCGGSVINRAYPV